MDKEYNKSMARPVKEPFTFRMDPAMREAIKIWSDRAGMRVSEFIRMAIINEAQRLGVYKPEDIRKINNRNDESN